MKRPSLLFAAASLAVAAGAAITTTSNAPHPAEPDDAVASAVTPAPAPSTPAPAAAVAVFLDEHGNRITPTAQQLAELTAATKRAPVPPVAPPTEQPTDPKDPSKGYMIRVPQRTFSVARINSDGTVNAHCLPADAAQAFLAEDTTGQTNSTEVAH